MSKKEWPKASDAIFIGVLGDIVKKVEPQSEADPIGIFVSLLSYFACIIGNSAHFMIEATRHSLNLFVAMIGATGEGRKGTASAYADLFFGHIEPELIENNVLSGLSSGEGAIFHTRDRTVKEVEGTLIETDSGVNDKRLICREEELASPFNNMKRLGNTLSAILRAAYDGRTLRSLTRKEPLKATNTHINILGHSTIEEFRKLISETDIFNGLLNRFIIVLVKRSRLLPRGGSIQNIDFADEYRRLKQAVNFAKIAGEITINADAWAIWDEAYFKLTTPEAGYIGALKARAPAHVRRIASLYALLDCKSIVEPRHLQAALALWDYALKSTVYIFGEESPEQKLTSQILQTIEDNPGITTTDLRKAIYFRGEAQILNDCIDSLVSDSRIVRKPVETKGRSRQAFFIYGADENEIENKWRLEKERTARMLGLDMPAIEREGEICRLEKQTAIS